MQRMTVHTKQFNNRYETKREDKLMKRIYIRLQSEQIGHVFRSKTSVKSDRVAMLPWVLIHELCGIIDQTEWATNQQTIAERLGLYISETEIDGRKKIAKSMEFFSWHNYLKNNRRKLV